MNQIERIEKLCEDFRNAVLREFGLLEPVKRFKPPTAQEVVDYFTKSGYKGEAGYKAWEYYNPEWKDSNGKQIKNWKQKMVGVWFKEENKLIAEKVKDPTNTW